MDTHKNTVLYDNDCGFCNWCRKQVENHAPDGFTFIDIRSKQALDIAREQGRSIDQNNPETFILLTPNNVWNEQSVAVKHIVKHMSGPWKVLYWILCLTPQFVGDWGYRVVAHNRGLLGRLLGEKKCKI